MGINSGYPYTHTHTHTHTNRKKGKKEKSLEISLTKEAKDLYTENCKTLMK